MKMTKRSVLYKVAEFIVRWLSTKRYCENDDEVAKLFIRINMDKNVREKLENENPSFCDCFSAVLTGRPLTLSLEDTADLGAQMSLFLSENWLKMKEISRGIGLDVILGRTADNFIMVTWICLQKWPWYIILCR